MVATLLVVLSACASSGSNHLLDVTGVEPRQVRFGSPWTVVGDGFALGSQPLVTLEGTVYRAGFEARPLRLEVRASAQSQERLRVWLPAELSAGACGGPDAASHATFVGTVQVAIAAHDAGAPPVTGLLRGARIELYPTMQTRQAEARAARSGRRMAQFAGMDLVADPEGGMKVVALGPTGRARRAGLQVGDRIVRAAGVTVFQESDIGTTPARSLPMVVSRGHARVEVSLDVDGFFPVPPRDVDYAVLPVAALALVLLFFGLMPRRLLGVLDPRHRGVAGRGFGYRADWSRKRSLVRAWMARFAWLLCAIGVACQVTNRQLGSLDQAALALLMVLLGAATLRGLGSVLRAGRVSAKRWSLRRAAGAAGWSWLCFAPAALVLLRFFVDFGLDFERLVDTQGAMPWRWRALAGPGEGLLLLLLIAPSVTSGSRSTRSVRESGSPGEGAAVPWLVCSTAGVAVLIFLGGGQLPSAVPAWPALTIAVALAKYAAVVRALGWVSEQACRMTISRWVGVAIASTACVSAIALTVLWRGEADGMGALGWLCQGFGAAAATALTLGVLMLWGAARGVPRGVSAYCPAGKGQAGSSAVDKAPGGELSLWL